MADLGHVAIVRGGSGTIAEWRRQHPLDRLDLRKADLVGLNLAQTNLEGAQLGRANLSSANLSRANLALANLNWTKVNDANLRRASLTGADLHRANLAGADLRGANLSGTKFVRADMRDAELSEAILGLTAFADCDLSQVHGLSSVRHLGPSSIGVDTVVRTIEGAESHLRPSQRDFFESAGVPGTLLSYLAERLGAQPIHFFSCFISYGDQDESFADRLYRDLTKHGLRCWKYDEDALVGRGVWANIDRAIAVHEKALVICSQSSLQRPGVQREIERALQREDELTSRQAAQPDAKIDTEVLFPARLDDYVLKGWEHPRKADVIAKHIGDFRGWDEDDANYQRGLEQLLRALDPRSKLGLSKGDLRQLGND